MTNTINLLTGIALVNELASLHNNGEDLQLIVNNNETLYRSVLKLHDMENVDDSEYIDEGIEYVIENVIKAIDEYEISVLPSLIDCLGWEDAFEAIANDAIVLYHDCHDMEKVSEQLMDDLGTDHVKHVMSGGHYLDEKQLLHDLYCGGDIQEYGYHLALEDALLEGMDDEEAQQLASDYEITSDDEEQYIEMILEGCDGDFLARYFDHESYGRDLDIEGTYIEFDGGMIEVTL